MKKFILCSRIYVVGDELKKHSIVAKKSSNSSQPSSSASKTNTDGNKVSKPFDTSKTSINSSRISKSASVPIRPTENNGLSRTKSITSSVSSKSRQKQSEPWPELDVPMPKDILTAKQSIKKMKQSRRQSTILTNSLLGLSTEDLSEDEDECDLDPKFKSCYGPEEMRCLALIAHNHMKPVMRDFVLANKNLLSKFKITGTCSTMAILREVLGDDPDVKYGPTCNSGALGGDAEIVAVMCSENLGACVFFQDPMSSHPHVSDIECLTRQANVHNIVMMPNPASAFVAMATFRIALKEGRAMLIPSFFETLMSPSVTEYKKEQKRIIEFNIEDLDDFS